MDVIASRKNPFVAAVRRVADGDDRDRLLLDGLHLLEEARAAQVPIASAAFTARALAGADGRARKLATLLAGTGVRVVQVADAVMDALSPTAQPSGVVAVAARPRHTLEAVVGQDDAGPALVVVAVDVQDPGNVGAIARVAEAAGATGYVVAGQSADPFGWKALRGSMGSVLRLPTVVEDDATSIAGVLRARRLQLLAAAPAGAAPFDAIDWRGPTACFLGSEGGGLPDALLAMSDRRVRIPMAEPVESLNVAVSAGLLLYEARRQRMAKPSAIPAAVTGRLTPG
jgi:TrmH family RNA methyltransferase